MIFCLKKYYEIERRNQAKQRETRLDELFKEAYRKRNTGFNLIENQDQQRKIDNLYRFFNHLLDFSISNCCAKLSDNRPGEVVEV